MTKLTLLFIFLAIKSIYIPLNRRKSKYYWKLPVDDMVPLIPVFIIPYVGYFFVVFGSVVVLWETPYISRFLISYIVSYVFAGIFWYLLPNGVARPKIPDNDVFSRLTKFIYKYDDDTNGFPSAHVFSTLICSHFLAIAFPESAAFIWGGATVVALSTIFVKQHYVIDIVGGLIVFVLSVAIGANLW